MYRLNLDTESIVQVVSDSNGVRKDLWKMVSTLERRAVELLTKGDEVSVDEAFKSLAESVILRKGSLFFKIDQKSVV